MKFYKIQKKFLFSFFKEAQHSITRDVALHSTSKLFDNNKSSERFKIILDEDLSFLKLDKKGKF
jgi:hypothetical protein